MALARIAQQSVGETIELVALGQHRGGERRRLGRRDHRARLGQPLRVPDEVGEQAGPVVGGRTGDDPIVVAGEALRLHQALPAAVRTRDEIAVARRRAVECLGQRLAGDAVRCTARQPKSTIFCGCPTAHLPSVPPARGRCRSPPRPGRCATRPRGPNRVSSRRIRRCRPLKAAVPVLGRQPDLERDMRIRRRMEHALDPAEGGKLDRRRRPQLRRNRERAGGLQLGRCNRRIGRGGARATSAHSRAIAGCDATTANASATPRTPPGLLPSSTASYEPPTTVRDAARAVLDGAARNLPKAQWLRQRCP